MVDVTIQYRDGGKDVHYGVKNVQHEGGVLWIEESNSRNVYIMLDRVSYFIVEEAKDEKDTSAVQEKS